jgi:acetyl esterase/lipase
MANLISSGRRASLRAPLALLGAVGLSGCSSSALLHAFVPTDTYRALPEQAYGPDPRHRLDLYLPTSSAAPAPLVVFFYGGSWTRGERADYRFVGEALAARGMAVAVVDYRLSPQVRYPAFLEDCALAVRWARDHAGQHGANPDRLFLMGHSAGAYNAAMLALDPRWLGGAGLSPAQLAGWIGLAGPYDFLPIKVPDVQQAFDWPRTPADSQPLFHARRASPPALLLAAASDDTVNPLRNTDALARHLAGQGVRVESALLEGVGHVTILAALARPLRWLAPVHERIERFVSA